MLNFSVAQLCTVYCIPLHAI